VNQNTRKVARMIQEILARWAQALGGIERLQQVNAIHVRMTVEMGGLVGTMEEWYTAQGQHRQRLDLGGVYETLTVLQSQKRGWFLDTNGKVRELAGVELGAEVTAAYQNSFSHLVPGRMPGQVEYPGEDEAYIVTRVLPQGGLPATFYLDRSTGLPVKEEHPDGERTRTVYLSDWRSVKGILFPFQIRQTVGDPRYDTVLHVEEIRFNVPLDGVAFQKPQESVSDLHFVGQNACGIPIAFTNNHVYLQVEVNGSAPLWFILDTGAEASVIDGEQAGRIGLQSQATLEGRGIGKGSIDVALIKGISFRLPGLEILDQTVAALSLKPLTPFEGRAIHGILGYDFISRFVVTIDYAARRVHLHDPADYTYTGSGKSIPITLESSTPHVRAEIVLSGRPSVEGKFLVDTGATTSLNLGKSFIEAHSLLNLVGKTIRAPSGRGVGGEAKRLLGRVQSLCLGEFVVQNPITGFSQDIGGAGVAPEIAGLIGGEILRRFTVVFDYNHQRMFLEKNVHFDEPIEYDMSGLSLKAEGKDFDIFRVHQVMEECAAAEAGLQEGDIITAIDGRQAADFTLWQLCQALKQEGHKVLLQIKRGDSTLEVEVKLRRLI
jgi:hypothetical protein